MGGLKIKVADVIIIGIVILAGLAGFRFNLQDALAAERKYVLITVENNVVTELSLAPGERFEYTFPFGDAGRHSARVEIEDGRVRMLPLEEGLCPRAICSHTGWIEHSYESIVCLPNRIMIVFHSTPGESGDDDIDGITY